MTSPSRTTLPSLAALALASLLPSLCAADGLPASTAPNAQWAPRIVANPAGGAWVTWLDRRTSYSTDVFGCLLDAAGAPSTGGADQGTGLTWITCFKDDLVLVPDGSGGTLAAWSDNRCGSENGYEVFVLRLGADGRPFPGWPLNGAMVRGGPGDQLRPAVAADGSGGCLVAWVDRAASPARLFAGRVAADGSLDPAWPAGGLLLAAAVSDSAFPAAAPDGAGGCYLAWDDRSQGHLDIRLLRLGAEGAIAPGWPAGGTGACTESGDQWRATLVVTPGGPIVAWLDGRFGAAQAHASRHLPDGSRAPGWPAGGVRLAPSATGQRSLVACDAGEGGAWFAWSEDRLLGTGPDLLAQRLDSTGAAAALWPPSGLAVCDAPSGQAEPAVVPDGAGGAYVAWSDRRDSAATGTDLYVQRLARGGAVESGWPANGAPLSRAGGDQREVRLAADGAGGAFSVWTDGRNAPANGDDIAARHVTPAGPSSVRARDLEATHRDGQTFLRWRAPPGRGWRYRVYASATPIVTPQDLATAALVGTAGDSSACDHRLSRLLGVPLGFRTQPGGPEPDPANGLFVRTVEQPGNVFYAVTSTPGSFAEDSTIVPGANSLVTATVESVLVPRPVFQRSLLVGQATVEVWTLWTWNADQPGFPAMAATPGLAFDCGLVRGAESSAPLVVRFHPRSGSFLSGLGGIGVAGEWVLALDDGLPNDENTFWFGYHPDYDVTRRNNPPPLAGPVVDYTARRVDWTFDWARRGFPVDTTRVFSYGYSMGAMGSTQLAFRSPEKLAGVMAVIGQYDFSFLSDPEPACWFNPGGPFRTLADQLWGAVGTNLPASTGQPVFDALNGVRVAERRGGPDLPPLMTFNGRRDVNVGWAEKVRFWEAMRANRHGGYFFWDNRNHGVAGAAWLPMQAPGYLDRFRTDRSYPALSHCDLDGRLGDGTPTEGDSVSSLNGALEWSVPDEDAEGWRVTLTLRALTLASGTVPAPESALVDVTPRRLQAFAVPPLAPVPYRIVRSADGAVLAFGTAVSDSFGLVTLERVRVHRSGTRVEFGAPAATAGAPGIGPGPGLRLACPSPVRRRSLAASVSWPKEADSRLDLIDVTGRRVLTLYRGRPAPGPARYASPANGLAPGLYFLDARCGDERQVRRAVLLE